MVSKYSRSAVVSAGVSLTKNDWESIGANQVGEFNLQKPRQMVQWLRICLAMQETLVQSLVQGLSWWFSGKETASQCRRLRRCRFDPWVEKIPWRKWQPIPVFLPGKFHGQRSLSDYSPWGHKESDTTERLSTHTKSIPHAVGRLSPCAVTTEARVPHLSLHSRARALQEAKPLQ